MSWEIKPLVYTADNMEKEFNKAFADFTTRNVFHFWQINRFTGKMTFAGKSKELNRHILADYDQCGNLLFEY